MKGLLMQVFGWFILICFIFGVGFGGVAGCAHYSIWSATMAGKATLAEATFIRQVAVQEAQAKMDSAHLLAQAEVERAKGVAQANKIIGDSLKDNESYLRYLWINNLDQGKNQVIYVPTEANLPIMEATRLNNKGDK